MKTIYLFLLFVCGMTFLNVVLFIANVYLGNEPFDLTSLIGASVFGVGACILGVKTYRKVRSAGDQKSLATNKQPRRIHLGRRLLVPILAMLVFFILIAVLIGIRSDDFFSIAPVLIFLISLSCFFTVRYLVVRRKYGEVLDGSVDVNQVITDLFGGNHGLIWLVATMVASIATIFILAYSL